MHRDDIDWAHEISYDERDVQCGREYPLFGEQMGNLTARGAHLFYTVKRFGDPMTHIPGGSSSRTACGWSVTGRDEVNVVDESFPTCVRCMAAALEQAAEAAALRAEVETYAAAMAASFVHALSKLQRR